MTAEYVLIIPHLSKELNLFGLPSLPYTLTKTGETKSRNKNNQSTPNIEFNSKSMIETLINVCLELIKQVKTLGLDYDSTVDKINFENNKLKKLLKQCELQIERKIKALNAAEKVNKHLQENITILENKVKNFEIKLKSLEKKGKSDKDILQHALKKKELDLNESYKLLRKQCYIDQSNFQKNNKIIQLNQSDFSKLWSIVKYSNHKTREQALKEAVCIFQENNRALIEKEFSLKALLVSVLQEIHEIFGLMIDTMHIPDSILLSFKNEMIWNTQGFDASKYNEILSKHLNGFKEVFKLFDKASFVVSDDLFVCLSHIFNNFKFRSIE